VPGECSLLMTPSPGLCTVTLTSRSGSGNGSGRVDQGADSRSGAECDGERDHRAEREERRAQQPPESESHVTSERVERVESARGVRLLAKSLDPTEGEHRLAPCRIGVQAARNVVLDLALEVKAHFLIELPQQAAAGE
jgi:hypothetical protein